MRYYCIKSTVNSLNLNDENAQTVTNQNIIHTSATKNDDNLFTADF